jgi:hypothetical protein
MRSTERAVRAPQRQMATVPQGVIWLLMLALTEHATVIAIALETRQPKWILVPLLGVLASLVECIVMIIRTATRQVLQGSK